ncbi:MAG: hypothetical protein ABJH68_06580 [Ilumatobacter sp.]|uniref:hypothetical protein n=1 Tax=Ilumatobacter sp. TaxID=1967498 RepID=UPI003298A1E2
MGHQGKIVERARARELRAEAWTLAEIAAELGVAKGSVSVWVRDVEFVAKPRNRNRTGDSPHPMTVRKQAELEDCRRRGQEFAATATDRDLYIWGLAMYHGEGSKTEASGFQLANTSDEIVAAFVTWMRRFFEIEETRLRASLYLHEGLDEAAAVAHWSHITGIPPGQFTKTYRPSRPAGHKTSKHEHGCVSIRYHDISLFRRVMAESTALTCRFVIPG